MKRNLRGIGDTLGRAVTSIGSAVSGVGKKLNQMMKGSTRSRAGGRMSASRPIDEAHTPIRSSAASNMHTMQTRPEPPKSRKFKVPFSLFNKKRFAAVLSGVVAAIMVPVFVSSAGGAGVFTSTNGSVNYAVPSHVDTLKANTGAVAVTAYTKATVVDTPASDESAQSGDSSQSAPVAQSEDQSAPQQSSTEGTAAEPVSPDGTDQAVSSEESVEPEEEPVVVLQPGDHSEAVVALQQRLMELHYMENDEPTDYYGPQTQQAVGYFQRKNGLDVDGCAGPKTQELLYSNDAKVYTVAEGASGLDVAEIQERLVELGYPVTVTGYYGTATASAVEYFQRMCGLTDDGSVGMNTKDILFSDSAVRAIPPEPDPEPEPQAEEEESTPAANSGGSSEASNTQEAPPAANSGGSTAAAESTPKPKPTKEPESAPEANSGGGSAPAANSGSVEGFVAAACAQEGKPYVLGGKGPNTFDCSGLVYYALNASGKKIGYMTSGGWAASSYPSISWDNLQRGDVVCFRGHVGVYLGGGMMCDASSSNGRIMIRSMGKWARNNFICGKRPL